MAASCMHFVSSKHSYLYGSFAPPHHHHQHCSLLHTQLSLELWFYLVRTTFPPGPEYLAWSQVCRLLPDNLNRNVVCNCFLPCLQLSFSDRAATSGVENTFHGLETQAGKAAAGLCSKQHFCVQVACYNTRQVGPHCLTQRR